MTIIISILATLWKNEWRYITGIGLAGVIIFGIYYKGYEASQDKIEKIKIEAVAEEKTRSAIALKTVQDDKDKEHEKYVATQTKLDAIAQKYNKLRACNINRSGVLQLNSLDR